MNTSQEPSKNTSDLPALRAASVVVEVGSESFFENCLRSMDFKPALGVLGSAETLNAQPLWLDAGIRAGMFNLGDRRTTGEAHLFVKGGQPAISRVLLAITELATASDASPPDGASQINPGLRDAYLILVKHIVAQVPDGHVTEFSKSKKTERAVPIDAVTLDLGMLLAGAVYLNDAESARHLVERCPSAALVPVCDRRRHLLHPMPLISAIGSALVEDRAEFLDLFNRHALDILRSPAFFSHDDPKVRLLDPTQPKALEAATGVLSRLSGTSGLDDVSPATLEVVLGEAQARTQRGELKESSLASIIMQGARNFNLAQMEVLLKSGAIADCADDLVEELVESLANQWESVAAVHSEFTRELIEQLCDNINFDKHLGNEFPPDKAFNQGLGSMGLAAELARQYAARSRKDLLIDPHNAGLSNQSDGSFTHIWAGMGATELVLLGLDLGADPQEKDKAGRTMIEYAEEQGMESTAIAIRAHAARAEAQAVIASIGREFLAGP